jgi:hypothetical protein
MSGPKFTLFRFAYQVIDGIPEERLKLYNICANSDDHFKRHDPFHCGTVGCAIGFLAMHPYFNEQGLRYGPRGMLYFKDAPVTWMEAPAKLFNMDRATARGLFQPVLFSERYEDTDRPYHGLTDKQVWQKRARTWLREHGQLTSQLEAACQPQ